MERVFRLKMNLACIGENADLPEGALVMEPRLVACDDSGDSDWVFLGSLDGGETWRERVPNRDWWPAGLV